MKIALAVLLLASLAMSAPAPQFQRRPGRFGSRPQQQQQQQQQVSNVNAQVTNVNQNNPNTLNFSGGLALASSNQVAGFGNTIAVNHAQVISQNIAIPVPAGLQQQGGNRFNNFNNRG